MKLILIFLLFIGAGSQVFAQTDSTVVKDSIPNHFGSDNSHDVSVVNPAQHRKVIKNVPAIKKPLKTAPKAAPLAKPTEKTANAPKATSFKKIL